MENVFKLFDLISDLFSGISMKVETEKDKYFIKKRPYTILYVYSLSF